MTNQKSNRYYYRQAVIDYALKTSDKNIDSNPAVDEVFLDEWGDIVQYRHLYKKHYFRVSLDRESDIVVAADLIGSIK